MFGSNKRRLKKILESDRYKNSSYVFQQFNGRYALKYKHRDYWVDLKSPNYQWSKDHRHFNDCVGSLRQVIEAFNYREPILIDICSFKML